MQKIFIVEDDPSIVESLKTALRQDFRVTSAMNFRAVKQEIEEFEADLVLMDLGLPYYNGLFWTRELRKDSQVPVIFISSSSDEMNQVSAMEYGADDFVVKPFSLTILKAKIRALLRRTAVSRLEFAGFVLEDSKLADVELSASENRILTALFKAQGEVVSKEALLHLLWQTDEFIDANTLAVKMSRLKKKLSSVHFDDHIQTKRGEGYALV
ncbi:MAG: response regulator transcription factor [Streptococcaceae bacterium]|jgi:DNA-binding response OmpR family regulator|nr:response regulator transcription factor [Streptococcaceae bacterium]